MRFSFLVLLLAIFLLVNGSAASQPTDSKASTSQSHAQLRFLRDGNSLRDEERALPPPPKVSLFADWVKAMGLKISDRVRARYWLWRKQSAEDVFKQLKLDGGLEKLLSSRKFNTWASFVNIYNKKNPNAKVTMAVILSKNYGDLELAKTLEVAMGSMVKTERKMATTLSLQQRAGWQAAGKSADDVFVLLKLDKAGDDLFTTPQLNSWYKYVSMQADSKSLMASVLRNHYSDEILSKIFHDAKPEIKRMRLIRVQLETAVAKSRPKKTLSPEKYFKMLKLDAGVDKLLVSPNLETWLQYVARYNTKNPGQDVSTIKILTKFYGDEELAKVLGAAKRMATTEKMATELQSAQLKQWLTHYSSDDVFKLLKLDSDVNSLLTNPSLMTWITFLGQFNAKNPGKGTTMVKTFAKFYGDIPLAKMLDSASIAPKTEKVATQFQTAQFKQWLRDGKKPAEVWKALKMEKATWMQNPDAQVWYKYKEFYKVNKQRLPVKAIE
ncbi:hypothetical protein V7S43_011143 [Phytophthora oleae]|uniref:RxLR effector protein n=1 Tax=Phytophthora oleae TaxID=2107226 RepID=A0ABD3FAD0_9STRA